ncbi:MAG: helix-turn-helix transcriptional regulator [Deltaproteobacteria bacterium]|nr:helix-turn-helix transcriptional regulator [Deltaproteobacteria bacterium]
MGLNFDKIGFLERLDQLRRIKGFSKGEFAEYVGVAQIFSRYTPAKPGQKSRKIQAPSVEALLTIAEKFNTSVDWLLTGRDADPEVNRPETPEALSDFNNWAATRLADDPDFAGWLKYELSKIMKKADD